MSSTGSSSSKYMLYFVGILLLIHSGYSAFEFHKYAIHYTHHLHQNTQGGNIISQSVSLPLDIYIEAVVGFIVVMVGALVSIENPVHISVKDYDKVVLRS